MKESGTRGRDDTRIGGVLGPLTDTPQCWKPDAGTVLTVPEGKGDKYRETPIPESLVKQLRTVDDMRAAGSDELIISW